jgi:predicted Zn-dependent peptidase
MVRLALLLAGLSGDACLPGALTVEEGRQVLRCSPTAAQASVGAGGLRSERSPELALHTVERGWTAAGAAIVVHRQPSLPVVALRLSLVANDPPGYAGAGHKIQHLVYPGLQERVQRVGGRVQMQRTSDAVVYTVTGPATELAYLAEVLISLLDRPNAPLDAILRAERDLREERLAEWETAPAHTRSHLRAQLFPGDLSAAGTDRSATRLTGPGLTAAWTAMYRPERVSVVAVGDVYLADVQRAFATLPAAPSAGTLPIARDSVVLGSLAPAQATRAWLGTAYHVSDFDPAGVTVTTRLLGDLLRRRIPGAQVEAEHWWTHHGQAIALVLAVPGGQLTTARRALGTAVSELLGEVDFLRTVAAATAVRREMLFFSRTPDRMADVLGQFIDREGDPNATERFYARLDAVDDDDIRRILERLIERTPARVEIPPQALQPPRRR